MTRSYRYVRVQRLLGYFRRMVPHVLGWFPCVAAWVCLIVQLENARNDLIPITDRRIPEWVDASLYGTFVIFFSFAPVQAIYQCERITRCTQKRSLIPCRCCAQRCRPASTGA